ncbi:MAG: hypothetical protein GY749_14525 [Desulfobacteraceae bacterium]|nr:hypothetical protein [Desulfobacteraceae bacterium]
MTDRKTPMMQGEMIPLQVAASTVIEAGKMAAADAAGYAVPAADAANLTVMGRAEEYKDNSSGSDGDETVLVRRKLAFLYGNSAANPVTGAHIGKNIYVEDAETVSSSGGTNSVVAGKCLGFEDGGVWTEIS